LDAKHVKKSGSSSTSRKRDCSRVFGRRGRLQRIQEMNINLDVVPRLVGNPEESMITMAGIPVDIQCEKKAFFIGGKQEATVSSLIPGKTSYSRAALANRGGERPHDARGRTERNLSLHRRRLDDWALSPRGKGGKRPTCLYATGGGGGSLP